MALSLLGHGGAASQTAPEAEPRPLSAIDWLSDSVQPAPAPEAPAEPPRTAAAVPSVQVAPLDVPVPDRFGLIDARELGLPAGLWGSSVAADLATMVAALPETRLPALRQLIKDLMLARLDPPVDAMSDDSLYLARLDKLLALGQLDAAQGLIAAAGAPEPRRFRRHFDIALLQGTENAACRVIETTPDISPTFPARIFCLARTGEWEVAALTLGTAEALGMLTPEEDALLLHFLDPELFEGEPLPPLPETVSPLMFRLYEAVGERPATEALPVAFAVADLSRNMGWKARLQAAERLAAAGALPGRDLVEIMRERAPAASGGVWDRVAAVQAMAAAIDTGDQSAFLEALPEVWRLAERAGYAGALAPWIARSLADIPDDRSAPHAAMEIALMAGRDDLARRFATSGAEDRTLIAAASGRPQDMAGTTPLVQAIRRALSGLPPSESYRLELDEGRGGEALLRAIAALAPGAEADPNAVGDALSVLGRLGMDRAARQIAVDILIEASRI